MEEREITIKPIFIDDVFRNDKISINTNNCWSLFNSTQSTDNHPKSLMPPADYHEVLNAGNTRFWINKFRDPSTYRTLVLDQEDLEWIRKATSIGAITGKFSELFEEDLKWTLEKNKMHDEWISKGEWFIRTEGVSLKNGIYGTGPYTNLEMVLKSIVSSNRTHRCFEDNDKMMTLYFLPFIKGLDHLKEFRVFVFQGEITAISQQSLYHQNPWLTYLYNENMLETLIREKILIPFKELIKPKMAGYLTNYVMDYALLQDPNHNSSELTSEFVHSLTPYFIEPNCWGANYAAGSSLFGWIQDHEKLHDSKSVEFRFTLASNEILKDYERNMGARREGTQTAQKVAQKAIQKATREAE